MYLLYADECGSVKDKSQHHFVLAGITVFERQTHWLSQALDRIAERFNPLDHRAVELHGSPMFGGRSRDGWRHFPKQDRLQAMKDALALIDGKQCRIIAAVVNKQAISPDDPADHCFQQLITRFDYYLKRQHIHFNNTQRGLIIFDKSEKEISIQQLTTQYKMDGHAWGNLNNMAEVPAFIDSKATRLIQLADLVAYALFRKYERQDTQFFDIIENKFDYFQGIQHGLYVKI